jgi:hypothetical protein
MHIRAVEPDDAPHIARIVADHDLPRTWCWPDQKHGLVIEHEGRVVAFCVLSENPWGLLTDELWQERTRDGNRGLWLLSRKIERVAQELADARGEDILAGGTVSLERTTHINALRRRGYREVGTVLAKAFSPGPVRAIGES